MTADTTADRPRVESFDLVISGAGIGALTLANYLAPLGFRILILDRRPALDPVHRGELVQPLGLEILTELSLLDELLKAPHSVYRSFDFLNERGELLMTSRYDLGASPFPYAISIEPHEMDQILARNLSPFSHIVIRHESDFVAFEKGSDGIVVTYVRGGEHRKALARVLVGDDGRHSRVRELAEIPGNVTPYRDSYLGGSLLLPEEKSAIPPALLDPAGRYFLGPGSIFFLFSVSERRRFFLVLLPDRNRDRFFQNGIAPVLDRLDKLVPGFAWGARQSGIDSIDSWRELPVYKVDLDTWCQDGVVLIGDAAHAMNPHVAQGRNQAMEDARVLAPVLSKALLSQSMVLRKDLLPYEQKRLPVTRELHRLADEMTWVWNSGHPLVVWGREKVFRGIGKSPSLSRKVVTTIGGTAVVPLSLADRLLALLRGLSSS
jgi:2-polyprenyl-6-methoxyphenol hydroxylase-like FAD-dependent oxidoreductase